MRVTRRGIDAAVDDHDRSRNRPLSFEDVFASEFAVVRSWLAHHGGQTADADDLTAEVFVRALRGWNGYRAEASRRTWLFAIARNVLANWRRRRGREATSPIASVPETAIEPEPAPLEVRADLDEILRRIPNDLARQAVELRFVDGCSVDEVADRLRTSPTAVTTLTHRALAKLRRDLRRRGGR